jgi:hypothetical protein
MVDELGKGIYMHITVVVVGVKRTRLFHLHDFVVHEISMCSTVSFTVSIDGFVMETTPDCAPQLVIQSQWMAP